LNDNGMKQSPQNYDITILAIRYNPQENDI